MSAGALMPKAMPDGILRKRLDNKRRDPDARNIQSGRQVDPVVEAGIQATQLQVEIKFHRAKLFLQANLLYARMIQDDAHQPAEVGEVVTGLVSLVLDDIAIDAVEGVEYEMRVHLAA